MNHQPDTLRQQAVDAAARHQDASRRRRLARAARSQRSPGPRSRRWRPVSASNHAIVVAYLALLLATAVAATGGTFILGKANAASSVSILTSSAGPALSLRAPSGAAPLQVNRNVKVTNLNADLLDGKDSTAFVPKATFDALRADHTALQLRVATLEEQRAGHETLAEEVAAVRELLAGVTREQVDGRATIRFSDVNLQLVNGTGSTGGTPNGLGNLIIGYSAQRSPSASRAGSHYLVIGDAHEWTRHGGLVTGQNRLRVARLGLRRWEQPGRRPALLGLRWPPQPRQRARRQRGQRRLLLRQHVRLHVRHRWRRQHRERPVLDGDRGNPEHRTRVVDEHRRREGQRRQRGPFVDPRGFRSRRHDGRGLPPSLLLNTPRLRAGLRARHGPQERAVPTGNAENRPVRGGSRRGGDRI
jgi:hypothetical protein